MTTGDEEISKTQKEKIEERLAEIRLWQKELSESVPEVAVFKKEEAELVNNLSGLLLRDNLSQLLSELSRAEVSKDYQSITNLTRQIQEVHAKMRALEERKNIL